MNMKIRLCSLSMIVLAALSIDTAWAQSMVERFDRVDRNRDGKVTREETAGASWFDRMLRGLDRNRNGVLERNEVASRGLPRGSDQTGDWQMPGMPEHAAHRDIRYAEIEGVDPNFLSLDLHVPKNVDPSTPCPVMVMIHGGGWRGGDKASPAIVGSKMRHFVGEGYIYASINYRLSPQTPDGEGVQHPVHAQDCARAIAWIHDHIAQYGGDPNQLHLMGHSAGGHLAAILGTNERFLKAEGKDLSILKTNVLLDPAAIDIPGYLKSVNGRGMTALYQNAFGKEKANHRDASPQDHVEAGKNIPPTLLFYASERMALDQFGPAFAKSLTEAGSPSRAVDTVSLDHGQINSHIGMIDEPMTQLIMRLHAGKDASKFPGVLPKLDETPNENDRAENEGDHEHDLNELVRFTRDYVPGTRDANGKFMGGTETLRLVAHDGKLFAGNGFWTDQPGDDPSPGAQILVKRGPNEPWEVSRSFAGTVRINAMESFTFTTDHSGKKLDDPVTLLLADAGLVRARRSGRLRCLVHDDATGKWEESLITPHAPRAYIRAFGFHRDAETGMEHVYAGTGAGEIYRGGFDLAAPGRIRWNAEPEYANPDFDGGAFKRCQGFTVANGKLYASVSPRLLERQDGLKPKWNEVFRWNPEQRAGAGLRGITAVPAPSGDHEVIIGSREQEGRILRIDPMRDYAVTDELNSRDFFDEPVWQLSRWQARGLQPLRARRPPCYRSTDPLVDGTWSPGG